MANKGRMELKKVVWEEKSTARTPTASLSTIANELNAVKSSSELQLASLGQRLQQVGGCLLDDATNSRKKLLSIAGEKVALVTKKKGMKIMSASSSSVITSPTENFLSGASASLVSKLVLQPFDTTKTVLQGSRKVRGNYSNLIDCAVGLVKTKGALSLYRGFLASIAVSAPSSAVFFTAYEHVKRAVETASRHPTLPLGWLECTAPVIAAALGNVVSSVVRVPPEVIKQRVQAGMYRDMLHATVSLWQQEGLPGFYTGYSTMVARDIPYAAIQFTVFEALKKRRSRILKQHQPLLQGSKRKGRVEGREGAGSEVDDQMSNSAHLLSNMWMGAVSGAIASVTTGPIDVVKTRVMTQELAKGGTYLGMRQMFVKIWAEEGIVAFGRGMAPRVLYKVPASALFLVCYEGIKRILRSIRRARQGAACRRQQQQQVCERGDVAPIQLQPLAPALGLPRL